MRRSWIIKEISEIKTRLKKGELEFLGLKGFFWRMKARKYLVKAWKYKGRYAFQNYRFDDLWPNLWEWCRLLCGCVSSADSSCASEVPSSPVLWSSTELLMTLKRSLAWCTLAFWRTERWVFCCWWVKWCTWWLLCWSTAPVVHRMSKRGELKSKLEFEK